jgi:carbonic anhydrase
MCETLEYPRKRSGLGRREFLKAAGVANALGLAGRTCIRGLAYADALTKAQRDEMTPEQIIKVRKEGNERFRKGERKNRNYLREQRASAAGQYPAAVLLSCIDSRAPAEVIMWRDQRRHRQRAVGQSHRAAGQDQTCSRGDDLYRRALGE